MSDVAREQFVGWIADHFQQRHATPLDRDDAVQAAAGALEGMEDMTGVPFGTEGHDWNEDAAHDMADEEIHAGWESAA